MYHINQFLQGNAMFFIASNIHGGFLHESPEFTAQTPQNGGGMMQADLHHILFS
ncbi:hypothetical protein Barb6XT_00585 [Bacteroidales bacterium Barb6XT]|nr:hypothetical protein Barb6XT_00585 [Bacteroidales bacterium Barb6XT]